MLALRERVNRCRKARAAHRADPRWLQPTLAGDRRWTARTRLQMSAQLRLRGRRRGPVELSDFSSHGCRIRNSGTIAVGNYAWLMLPTLESWYARIAWCDGAAAGLDFAEPLHRAVADMLIQRSPAARPIN